MSVIGLERGRVALYDHDFAWDREAERVIAELKSILGCVAKDLAHVGSTAVNSIKAKPIIDIVVAVADFANIVRYDRELRARGFYYRFAVDGAGNRIGGEVDFSAVDIRQLLYACGGYYDGSSDLQTHFIHAVKFGSVEWRDCIEFRDILNADPIIAKEYEALKIKLCAEHADDRAEYTARKREFISRVLSGVI